MPVTSYCAGNVRASPARRPSDRSRVSVGVRTGGPKSAARRRERQHVRDVVEAVSRVVLRKVVRRAQVEAEQIADRVVVFRAVQPPRRHAPGIGGRDPVDARQFAREPFGDGLPLMLRRLRLFIGRHLPMPQLRDDVVPVVALLDQRRGRGERLEVQFALVLLVAVAGNAVLRDKRLDEGLESVRGRGVQDARGFLVLLSGPEDRRYHEQAGNQECAHGPPIITVRRDRVSRVGLRRGGGVERRHEPLSRAPDVGLREPPVVLDLTPVDCPCAMKTTRHDRG